jgi:hypothetical protein
MAINEVNGGLGLTEMINRLIAATWKSPRRKGLQQLIQQQTEQVFLTYLLSGSADENLSFATRSILNQSLQELKTYIETQKKQSPDALYLAHLTLALERYRFPEKAKPTQHAVIPPGAPIGCDWEGQ